MATKKKFKELQLLARSQNWALGGMQGRTGMTQRGLCASIQQVRMMLPRNASSLKSELLCLELEIENACHSLLQLQDDIKEKFAQQRTELREKLESESNGN